MGWPLPVLVVSCCLALLTCLHVLGVRVDRFHVTLCLGLAHSRYLRFLGATADVLASELDFVIVHFLGLIF